MIENTNSTSETAKKDIFFYKGNRLFETKEGFAIQALTAPNQEFLYSDQMGMNDLSYFQAKNTDRISNKRNATRDEQQSSFFITLRNSYTTKLSNNGIKLQKFDISNKGYIYGEIIIKIEGFRFQEMY